MQFNIPFLMMKMKELRGLPYNIILLILEFVELNSIILFLADNKHIHMRICPESLKQQLLKIRERLSLPEQEIEGTIGGVIEQYQSIGRLDNDTIRIAVSSIGAWEAIIGPIETWDVSKVTNMSYLFAGNKHFNKNISAWETREVTTMRAMFGNATAFNKPVEFNVPEDTGYMFYGATSFDQFPFDTSTIPKTEHMLDGTVIGKRFIIPVDWKYTTSTVDPNDMTRLFLDLPLPSINHLPLANENEKVSWGTLFN